MTKRLDYKGNNIRIYNDFESCCLLIIGDFGELKQVCYDDNFFSVQDLYYEFVSLLVSYYNDDEDDEDFNKEKIRFEKHLNKQGVSIDELEECREYYLTQKEWQQKRKETIKQGKTKRELEQAYINAYRKWESHNYNKEDFEHLEDAQSDLLDCILKGGN